MCACLIMVACTNKKEINSKNLQGKYEIDFSSVLDSMEDEDDLTKAFAALILSSLKMSMEFDNDELILDGSTEALNILGSDSDDELPLKVNYEIREDSVIYILDEEEAELLGTIRKYGDTFDSLMLVTSGAEETTILKLRKVAAE